MQLRTLFSSLALVLVLGLASAGNLRGEPRALQQQQAPAAAAPSEAATTLPQPVAKENKEAAKDSGYSVSIPYVGTFSVNYSHRRLHEAAKEAAAPAAKAEAAKEGAAPAPKEAAKDGYSVTVPFVGTFSTNWYSN